MFISFVIDFALSYLIGFFMYLYILFGGYLMYLDIYLFILFVLFVRLSLCISLFMFISSII